MTSHDPLALASKGNNVNTRWFYWVIKTKGCLTRSIWIKFKKNIEEFLNKTNENHKI